VGYKGDSEPVAANQTILCRSAGIRNTADISQSVSPRDQGKIQKTNAMQNVVSENQQHGAADYQSISYVAEGLNYPIQYRQYIADQQRSAVQSETQTSRVSKRIKIVLKLVNEGIGPLWDEPRESITLYCCGSRSGSYAGVHSESRRLRIWVIWWCIWTEQDESRLDGVTVQQVWCSQRILLVWIDAGVSSIKSDSLPSEAGAFPRYTNVSN